MDETRGSSGVAKAGLTLGIIGTSLAGLLWANGKNGTGLFNFNGGRVMEYQRYS